MMVNDILKSVQAAGGILRVDGGKLVLEADCGVIGQDLKEAIRKRKEEIIRVLSPPVRPAVQSSKEIQAKEEVSLIEAEALAAGWERDQLDELEGILKIYMPNCGIGAVSLRAIQIIHFYPDGTIRNYTNFYNMRARQPWNKRLNVPPTG